MSGDHSLYVRTDSVDEIRSVVPEWIDMELDEHCDYARLTNADDWTELAKTLSSAGREVIELGFQSTVDAFRYARWVNGKPSRVLQLGWSEDEGTWELVAGTPEAWETVFAKAPKVGLFMAITAMEIAAAAGEHHKLTSWYEEKKKKNNNKRVAKRAKGSRAKLKRA